MPKLLNIKFQVSITVGELVLHNAIVFKQAHILFQPQSIDQTAGNIGRDREGGRRHEGGTLLLVTSLIGPHVSVTVHYSDLS